MNTKMFKKIIKQTSIVVDFSPTNDIKANTVKIIKINDVYYAYIINDRLEKTLITKTTNESDLYKSILKHHHIKLNKFGDVITSNKPCKRN